MTRRTHRPSPRRSRTRRRPPGSTAAIVLSSVLLAAVLVVLALVTWRAWRDDQRERAAWRRVGSCEAVGDTATVTCTGVHLVWLQLPRSIAACGVGGVCRVRVNREAVPAFHAALDDVAGADLGGALTVFQTLNRRRCRDAVTGTWIAGCISKHSYGIAVDVRPVEDNATWDAVTDRDARIMEAVAIFRSHGFRWGGTFSTNFDPQHLEWIPGSRLHPSRVR